MRIAMRVATVDEEKCEGCSNCIKVCPVEAISLKKKKKKRVASVDDRLCLDCALCTLRCPEYALSMKNRDKPLRVGVSLEDVSESEVVEICHTAHMYPDQVVCFCQRVQAKEVAAAILQGAKTPEDVSRATGARTGCGVLCITGIIRLLRAAGVELTRAPGYQWYGIKASIWDIPLQVAKKYPHHYIAEDLAVVNEVFPKGDKKK